MNRQVIPRRHLVLLIILAVSLGLRLGWGMRQGPELSAAAVLGDQVEYLQLGRNLLAGQGLQFTDPRFRQKVWAYRTPGYPIFIAMLGGDVRAVRVGQAIVDVGTVLGVYLLARRWMSARGSLAAAAVVGVNPLLIYFSGLVLSETVFVGMVVWGVVMIVWGKTAGEAPTLGKRNWLFFWGGVAVLALAVLVRPSAVGLPALFVWLAGGKGRNRNAVIAAAMTFAVLFPWAWRNHQRLGVWVWTTTNSGVTQYDGFNPGANGGSDQTFLKGMPELSGMGEVERNRVLSERAWEFIWGNPGRCVELTGLKIVRFWSPVPMSGQFGRPVYVVVGLVYGVPLMVLTVVGIWGAGLPRAAKGVLLLSAVYFMVIHAVSVSSMRYRLPAEPFMAVAAVASVVKKTAPRELEG